MSVAVSCSWRKLILNAANRVAARTVSHGYIVIDIIEVQVIRVSEIYGTTPVTAVGTNIVKRTITVFAVAS